MKRITKVFGIAVTVALLLCIGVYRMWRSSATLIPGWTSHSPDGRFRIEFYRVWTMSGWLGTPPGQGSDAIDGFIRLYRSDGTLLQETYRNFLRGYEPRWSDDEAYFPGDGPVWKLPETKGH